jgi:hypothetical protein
MTIVKISVEEGLFGLGQRFDVTVRAGTAAEALAGALAAVLPRAHLTWGEVMHAARAAAAAREEARRGRGPGPGGAATPGGHRPPGGPGIPAGHPLVRVPQIPPEVARVVAAQAARLVAGVAAAAVRAAASLTVPPAGRGPAAPPAAGPAGRGLPLPVAPLVVLPDEARDWNAAYPEMPLHPGSVEMTAGLAIQFLAFRAGRAIDAQVLPPAAAAAEPPAAQPQWRRWPDGPTTPGAVPPPRSGAATPGSRPGPAPTSPSTGPGGEPPPSATPGPEAAGPQPS